MAVYTHFSFDDLHEIFSQQWGQELLSLEPVTAGIENSIYKVTCKSLADHSDQAQVLTQEYAFVVFENLDHVIVERYCQVLSQIQAAARFDQSFTISTAMPILQSQLYSIGHGEFRVDCQFTLMAQHKPIILQPWIPGEWVKPNDTLCYQLGVILAQIQAVPVAALQYLPQDEHLTRIHRLLGRKHLLNTEDQLFCDQTYRQLLPVIQHHQAMNYGLVHGDLFTDNALANNDQLTGIIDFFAASNAPSLLDIAISIFAWCTSGEGIVEKNRVSSLVAGYKSMCQPSTNDTEYFYDLVLLCVFRFWCSRQTYQIECFERGIKPVSHRHPHFIRQVWDEVQSHEAFIRQLFI